jgi:hypothetical protein
MRLHGPIILTQRSKISVTDDMPITKASIRASKKFDDVLKVYEFHDHQHAIAILTVDFPNLLAEICDVLLAFRISIDFIKKAGVTKAKSQKLYLSDYDR